MVEVIDVLDPSPPRLPIPSVNLRIVDHDGNVHPSPRAVGPLVLDRIPTTREITNTISTFTRPGRKDYRASDLRFLNFDLR